MSERCLEQLARMPVTHCIGVRAGDLMCDLPPRASRSRGVIEADGIVIQRDGRFVLPGWPGR
ncbi:MAG: hypothetical protein KJZ65_10125 [Phycisphaerales bacterium]|nr:hypothetical protein [Phycisphaerales bacterium]